MPAHQLFHCDEERETNLSLKKGITKIQHFQNGSILKSVLYNVMFLEQVKTTNNFHYVCKLMHPLKTSLY